MTIAIRALTHLDPADLRRTITGYTSPAKYAVTRVEADDHAAITLQLVPFDPPYVKTYDHLDDETVQRYAGLLPAGFCWGAYDADRLVGVAIAEPWAWNRSLWVWDFHIADIHRGRGIGRRLMEALAEQGRAADLRIMVCETQNTNVPAIRFYRRVGFTLDSVDLSYYTNHDFPDGEIAIFMKRRLD